MKIKVMLASLLLGLTMKSCVVYSPQTADIPLIHEKNDFRFDGGVSFLKPSLNSTLSYGLTNKLAIQAYGNWDADDGYYVQGALGYYKLLQANTVLEVYGGSGYGYGYTSISSTGGSLYGNYTLPFVQLNLGKIGSEASNLEYGMGLKTGLVFADLTEEVYDGPDPRFQSRGILIEPIVFLRPGGKRAKVNFKLSGTWVGNLTNDFMRFPHNRINVGISLNLR